VRETAKAEEILIMSRAVATWRNNIKIYLMELGCERDSMWSG
jgi:hypothetical protein